MSKTSALNGCLMEGNQSIFQYPGGVESGREAKATAYRVCRAADCRGRDGGSRKGFCRSKTIPSRPGPESKTLEYGLRGLSGHGRARAGVGQNIGLKKNGPSRWGIRAVLGAWAVDVGCRGRKFRQEGDAFRRKDEVCLLGCRGGLSGYHLTDLFGAPGLRVESGKLRSGENHG